MKKIAALLCLLTVVQLSAQQKKSAPSIAAEEVARVENVLASDAMKGRKTYSPEIDKAADFIAAEFKNAGLQPVKGSFKQAFFTVSAKQTSINAKVDGVAIDSTKIVTITSEIKTHIDGNSGYEIHSIKAGEELFRQAIAFEKEEKNKIVFVDSSFSKMFPRLSFFKRNGFKKSYNTVFILGNTGKLLELDATHNITENKLANVVGVLPGKSKKDEFVIFSGHYDHLGIGKPDGTDSIYNGANDDAAGTTAVILLSKYFSALKNNERSLVFVAFTAEEMGGFGSQYFSQQMDPSKVVAMFNIEMIGTESKWGKNSAFITGYEKTDMGKILQADLKGTDFTFYPDPYPTEKLFYRSDNATLARLGVPAHTISTSKMDNEPNYHKVSDEVKTLDLDNMARVITSIALSSKSIIAGKATPTRVQTGDLD